MPFPRYPFAPSPATYRLLCSLSPVRGTFLGTILRPVLLLALLLRHSRRPIRCSPPPSARGRQARRTAPGDERRLSPRERARERSAEGVRSAPCLRHTPVCVCVCGGGEVKRKDIEENVFIYSMIRTKKEKKTPRIDTCSTKRTKTQKHKTNKNCAQPTSDKLASLSPTTVITPNIYIPESFQHPIRRRTHRKQSSGYTIQYNKYIQDLSPNPGVSTKTLLMLK